MRVEVAILFSPSRVVPTVSVPLTTLNSEHVQFQSSGAVCKSRWPTWAPRALIVLTVFSVDVKQQRTGMRSRGGIAASCQPHRVLSWNEGGK